MNLVFDGYEKKWTECGTIGHESSFDIYMDENFLLERINFREKVILKLIFPIHEYFIDDFKNITEYGEITEPRIPLIIHS